MLSAYGFVRFYLHFSPGFCTVSCKVVYFSHQRAGEPPGDSREGGARSPHHSGLWRLLPGRAFYLVLGQIPALKISSVILGLQRFPVIWLSVQLGSITKNSWVNPFPLKTGATMLTHDAKIKPKYSKQANKTSQRTEKPRLWNGPRVPVTPHGQFDHLFRRLLKLISGDNGKRDLGWRKCKGGKC